MAGAGGTGVRSHFHFQFITTPTADTHGTSLLLHFDNKRYIFGEVSEGIQRACIERNIGLRKVRHMFLSGKPSWNNGGLLGLILTMADVQHGEIEADSGSEGRRPRLHIHSGPKQLHSLACARRFIFRTGMPLTVHEFDLLGQDDYRKPFHEDENIKVWAIAARHGTAVPGSSPDEVAFSDQDSDSGKTNPPETTTDKHSLEARQKLREQIVQNMFDSDWKADRLFDAKIKDVKLPAMVFVRDQHTKQLRNYPCTDINSLPAPLTPESDVLIRNPWPASTVEALPDATGLAGKVAMSYIVKGHPRRGNFDPKKAAALGLKPGPIYKELIAGRTVQNGDGATITPDMVIEPTKPGRGVALFDVPSTGYLGDLDRQLKEKASLLENIEAVIWMTQGEVPYKPAFQDMLRRMKGVKHIISNPSLCGNTISYIASARSMKRLSKISSEYFSAPDYDNTNSWRPSPSKSAKDLRSLLDLGAGDPEVSVAQRGLKINIEPSFKLDKEEVPVAVDLDRRGSLTALHPEIETLLPQQLDAIPPSAPASSATEISVSEPEVITLGTGSALPSKYRNVSSNLLRMPKGMGNYLFDCGENTLGQLQRLYSPAELDSILVDLKTIWISHLHADHHLGTISVLKAAFNARSRLSSSSRPPCLVSEVNMIDYMDEYQSVLCIPTDSLCVPVVAHWDHGLSVRDRAFSFSDISIPIKKLETVRVNHCHAAQAVAVTFSDGFKIGYSGDCRPSADFCRIGMDADVLIHEGTFDDGMDGDAYAKKHCTTGEAVGVAVGMKAKNLILTHFSQRYQKLPILESVKMPQQTAQSELLDDVDAEQTPSFPSASGSAPSASAPSTLPSPSGYSLPTTNLHIAIAFDLARFRLSKIMDMKVLFPAISKMFEIEAEKSEKLRLEAAQPLKDYQARLEAEKAENSKRKRERQMKEAQQAREERAKRKSEERKRRREQHAVNGVTGDSGENGAVDVGSGDAKSAQARVTAKGTSDHSTAVDVANANGATAAETGGISPVELHAHGHRGRSLTPTPSEGAPRKRQKPAATEPVADSAADPNAHFRDSAGLRLEDST